MKTIGYRDRIGPGSPLRIYVSKEPNQRRHDRIKDAINDLRHMGNIVVYLIDGNKTRELFTKPF